jgi:hypothetical protein
MLVEDLPWGTYADAKSYFTTYSNVLLVCVYENTVRDDNFPHPWSLLEYKATVVRVYKGNRRLSERIAYGHNLDSRIEPADNTECGDLHFILTNSQATNQFAVDTGELLRYDVKLERLLNSIFSGQNEY